MAFGKVARATKATTPLKDLIEQKFRQEEPKPFLTTSSYIRCSAFSSLCPREELLCAVHEVTRKQVVEASLNLTFSHGTALHHILQNNILPGLETILYGHWRCKRCGKLHSQGDAKTPLLETVILRPKECCGKLQFEYEEASLHSEQYRLTGHPDGFLKLPQYEGFGILEAKSISPKGAYEVKRVPKMDHVIQAQMYMWFTGTQWAQILYWDKGAYGLDCLIEHHVERDDDVLFDILGSIDGLWAALKLWEDQKEKKLPARICATHDCPRANVCSVAKQCFAEEA